MGRSKMEENTMMSPDDICFDREIEMVRAILIMHGADVDGTARLLIDDLARSVYTAWRVGYDLGASEEYQKLRQEWGK